SHGLIVNLTDLEWIYRPIGGGFIAVASRTALQDDGEVDTFHAIEELRTHNGGDAIFAETTDAAKAWRIDSGNGNDTVWGGAGDDTIIGGMESDLLFGGGGHDSIVGGMAN